MERAAPTAAKPPPQPSPRAPVRPSLAFGAVLAKLGLGKPVGVGLAPPPLPGNPQPSAHRSVPGRPQPEHHEHRDPSKEAPAFEPEDPTWTHRAALVGPPPMDLQQGARAHVESVARHASLEELAPQLLRRLAWSGDGRRGAARLELQSGAVLTLEADGREVALAVDGLTASEEASLRSRLSEGLSARGFRLVG